MRPLMFSAIILALASSAFAQQAAAPAPVAWPVFDETIAPGANYDKAEFRLTVPLSVARVRAVLVLVPGSNGDGRPMAEDAFWQAFAAKHQLAIVACRFTDKPHEQAFLEDYVAVANGSGQALLGAVSALAKKSNHPEIATAPFLMWGMSAGGQVNYEFAAWKPERVIAFVVNKGGVYYSALVPRAPMWQSMMVMKARLNPRSTACRTFFPARSSSRMRSKIRTFASTAMPRVRISPAIPGRVRAAPK